MLNIYVVEFMLTKRKTWCSLVITLDFLSLDSNVCLLLDTSMIKAYKNMHFYIFVLKIVRYYLCRRFAKQLTIFLNFTIFTYAY